jgi:hypothetical protein
MVFADAGSGVDTAAGSDDGPFADHDRSPVREGQAGPEDVGWDGETKLDGAVADDPFEQEPVKLPRLGSRAVEVILGAPKGTQPGDYGISEATQQIPAGQLIRLEIRGEIFDIVCTGTDGHLPFISDTTGTEASNITMLFSAGTETGHVPLSALHNQSWLLFGLPPVGLIDLQNLKHTRAQRRMLRCAAMCGRWERC